MKSRISFFHNARSSILLASLLTAFSASAVAQSTVSLDPRAPLQATLLPEMKVTASMSNPHAAPRWSVASTRPVPVTLMPTLTITADAEALAITRLPTITVIAQAGQLEEELPFVLAVASMPANSAHLLAD